MKIETEAFSYIRIHHPTFRSEEITGNIDMVVYHQGAVGERTQNLKRELEFFNEKDFITYNVLDLQKDINLETVIEITNKEFEASIKNKKWLHYFIETGGKITYFIGAYIGDESYAFELSPEILEQCAELHVHLECKFFYR